MNNPFLNIKPSYFKAKVFGPTGYLMIAIMLITAAYACSDLTPNVLEGNQGPTGPQGPSGSIGLQGPQGAAGGVGPDGL